MSKDFEILKPDEKARKLYQKIEKIFIDANADSWGYETVEILKILSDEVIGELEDRKQHIDDLDVPVLNLGVEFWEKVKAESETIVV